MVTLVVRQNGYQVFDNMFNRVYNCANAKILVNQLQVLGIEKEEIELATLELEKNNSSKAVFGINRTFICTE